MPVESLTPSTGTKPEEPRRKETRARSLLAGKIVFARGARSIDCTIRDLTQSGAKVKLTSAELIPSSVFLIDIRRGLAIESEVAWSKPKELGLKFGVSHSLQEQTSDPALAAMRRIWVEHVAR